MFHCCLQHHAVWSGKFDHSWALKKFCLLNTRLKLVCEVCKDCFQFSISKIPILDVWKRDFVDHKYFDFTSLLSPLYPKCESLWKNVYIPVPCPPRWSLSRKLSSMLSWWIPPWWSCPTAPSREPPHALRMKQSTKLINLTWNSSDTECKRASMLN